MSNERINQGNMTATGSNIVQMKGSIEQGVFVTELDKAELATQVAAIVRASFKPLTDSDMRDVLRLASVQLRLA